MLVVLAVLVGQERKERLEKTLCSAQSLQVVVVLAQEALVVEALVVRVVAVQVVKVVKQAIAVLILQLRAMQVVLAAVGSVLVVVVVHLLSEQTQPQTLVGMVAQVKHRPFLVHL